MLLKDRVAIVTGGGRGVGGMSQWHRGRRDPTRAERGGHKKAPALGGGCGLRDAARLCGFGLHHQLDVASAPHCGAG